MSDNSILVPGLGVILQPAPVSEEALYPGLGVNFLGGAASLSASRRQQHMKSILNKGSKRCRGRSRPRSRCKK